ncbi:unnamed protein product [Leuciscus chuanchicus]
MVRDVDAAEPDPTPPGIIGMNITQRCRELALTEFDTTLGGKLDSVWREAFTRVQEDDLGKTMSTARVSCRGKTHIPASSVATIYARINKRATDANAWLLLEPGSTPLPGGLIPMPTLVSSRSRVFPVQVVNFSQEDVWLPPKVQLGILTHCQCVESEACQVRFQRISADHEEVRVDQKDKPESGTDPSNLLSRLHIGGTPEQQARLGVLLLKYADVFAACDEDLGYTDRVKHELHLTDETPVAQPYRRIPPTQFDKVKEHISGLLRKGVIQESSSSYASPIVLVRKSDGSLRLAQVFSTIDLASGYHQVAVHEKDRPKMAFITPFGLYEYRRMPFGLCNAPATFQRLMQAVMSDLVFQIVLIYLDDLLVYSSSFHTHLVRLETVFGRLRETGLKIKIEKCHFLQPEVRFQGHQVSPQAAVREWPVPSTLKERRSFLGFCSYYRRFIEGFSQVAGPLHDVVNVCLRETSHVKAVQLYKSVWTSQLTSAPTLGYADSTLPFVIETDASNQGLGAVLYQQQKVKYRPGRCNTAADALSRRPGSDEPDSASEDAEYDGCVAICNLLRTGTALGPDLLAAGVECSKVRQLQATSAGEEDIACENTPTLPGYSKSELRQFQESDPTLSVFKKFWSRQRKPASCMESRKRARHRITPRAILNVRGYSPYCLLFGIQPHLPVDALLGQEPVTDDKPDWLKVHQERLRDAHRLDNVYLRHRPLGRNKFQDAWSSTMYKVLEVQGTTYTVEPVEGGTMKRVHRSNLRPCNNPVPMPRRRQTSVEEVPSPDSESEITSLEAECVLVEEVPCLKEKLTVEPASERQRQPVPGHRDRFKNQTEESDRRGYCSEPERNETPDETLGVTTVFLEPETESVHLPAENPAMRPVPAPRKERKECVKPEVSCPAVRRTQRTTAGVHSNPNRLPKSTCNAVSFSPDVLSQVLAGMVLYTTGKLQGGAR